MDLAVLIIGIIMGAVGGYFTYGPGKEKMKPKERTVTKPAKPPKESFDERPY